MLPLLPVACCLVAAGVISWNPKIRFFKIVPLLLLPLVFLAGLINQHKDPLCRRENWNQAASLIEAYERPGDVIFIPNRYHSLGFDFAYGGNLPVVSYVSDTPHETRVDEEILKHRMERLEKDYRRFWIVSHKTSIFDPENFLARYTESDWKKVMDVLPKPALHDIPVALYARDEQTLKDSMLKGLDFRREADFDFQVGTGFLEQTREGYCWMGKRAEVMVARAPGDNLAYGCFFVHRPFFGDRDPVARLLVNGFPVATRAIEKTDMHCLEGIVPDKMNHEKILAIGIEFDHAFVPDEILSDGDKREKTALVERMGVTTSSRWIARP
jgi:hypothetical protein